jgi:PAS domain-containing protein
LGIGKDITAKFEAEQQLQEQKAFYETILSHLPSDIAVPDSEFGYVYLNPLAVRNPELCSCIVGKTDYDYCLP